MHMACVCMYGVCTRVCVVCICRHVCYSVYVCMHVCVCEEEKWYGEMGKDRGS